MPVDPNDPDPDYPFSYPYDDTTCTWDFIYWNRSRYENRTVSFVDSLSLNLPKDLTLEQALDHARRAGMESCCFRVQNINAIYDLHQGQRA